jgi:hypothetical protein
VNSQEARKILEVYRPGRDDAAEPCVTEALKCVERDPALARWFAAQRGFDDTMSAVVKDIAVPADLKESILAARKVVKVPFWRQPLSEIAPHWRVRAAAAAALILIAGGGILLTRQPARFVDFRQELIARDWAGDPHLDFESSDITRIKAWLGAHDASANFTLPPGLSGVRIHGCRLIERDGEKVSLICFAEGPKHLHLFILNRADFHDLPPEGAPDFEKCGVWKTASWRQGDRTYVLTGMNYQTFVSKFRKAGRWTMSG